MNKLKKRGGFTLIELLVVVAIIGILSSVALTALNSARASSRDSYRIQSLTSIRTAVEMYKLDHDGAVPPGTYYTTFRNDSVPPYNAYSWTNLQTLLALYMPKLPNDPQGSGCNGAIDPGPPCNGTTDNVWWMYTSSFQSGMISNGFGDPTASGSCFGKALLLMYRSETGQKRQECEFQDVPGVNTLKSFYPNATIILLN